MAITRKFIDWSQPALPVVAEYLLQQYGDRLDQVLVVVPGSRAGRRLVELLVELAEQQQRVFFPPQIVTVGKLPEMLYESKRPMATEIVQQMAWIRALQSIDRRRLSRHIPELPEKSDVARWLSIGTLLWHQHRELAADGLSFADVLESGEAVVRSGEVLRWKLLRDIQRRYLTFLDKEELWDRQTARLYAIEHRECHLDRELVLVATADMNRAIRQMLDQLAGEVIAIVHAPESHADRFDRYGCIDPEPWSAAAMDIPIDQVSVVGGPNEQAAEVSRLIAQWGGRYRADEICIGVLDDHAAPQIERQLRECELSARSAVGKRLRDCSPFRLLHALSSLLLRDRYREFASLIRHPDVDRWLQRQGLESGWLEQLDRYYANHLTPTLGQWYGDPSEWDRIEPVFQAIQKLVQPHRGRKRKLGAWSRPILEFLLTVYDGVEFDRLAEHDHYQLSACQRIQSLLNEHELIPNSLSPVLDCSEAIRLLLDQAAGDSIAPLADEHAIEMLGWLELPLDTAPQLVVTSFNDGLVPSSLNSDLFMPNQVRSRLNLVDNQRRYARDAYAVSAILAGRPETQFVVPRRNDDGDPLNPSRLLFARPTSEVAQRAIQFFDTAPPPVEGDLAVGVPEPGRTQIFVPEPQPLKSPPERMEVTAFRTYLACPYHFYLRHIRRLRTVHDQDEEMSAASFGDLIHEILRQFGESDFAFATQYAEVKHAFDTLLDESVETRFGGERLPAVNVQITQLRSRLHALAWWQAQWTRSGWQIHYTESPHESLQTKIEVEEGSLQLFGRIDRIDYHPGTDQWVIFDYKTGDSAQEPDKSHRHGGQWTDLQLPLYRHLAATIGVPKTAQLGYIVVPSDSAKVGDRIADWSPAELDNADQLARQVVSHVLQEKFWPPNPDAPTYFSEFASITQRNANQQNFRSVEERPSSRVQEPSE